MSINDLNDQHEAVSKLIGSLPHVDAPSTFEFSVRARIAARRAERPRYFGIPMFARLAAPAAVALAAGGYFGYHSLYPATEGQNAMQTASIMPSAPVTAPMRASNVATSNFPAAADPVAAAPCVDIASKITPTGRAAERGALMAAPKTPAPKAGGGSYEEALTQRKPILPRGFDPNSRIPVKDVLNIMGIGAEFDGQNWRVSSAAANSIGHRSGVKAGDVIEAIDGQPLSASSSVGTKSVSKSLRIHRGTQTIDIPLKH